MTTATYRNEILSDFRGNLLIEALPEPREPAQAIKDLMVLPDYSGADRQLSVANRRILTQNIARIHHPLPRELEVEGAIDRCLRWGYVDRDPLLPGYAAQLSAGYKASLHGNGIQNKREYHPHTYGFSILGISGIGKSTTVETILSHYPQVIRHSNYQGIPLSLTQVTWAKLDCPADGSLKGLCLSFFDQLDRLLGTDYCDQYRKRTTLDVLMLKMAQLATAYNVGLIVLDELQNLCSAAKDVPAKVLNYLVTLVNSIGVPVILTIFSHAPGFVHFYRNQDKTSFCTELCFVHDHCPQPASFLRCFKTSKKMAAFYSHLQMGNVKTCSMSSFLSAPYKKGIHSQCIYPQVSLSRNALFCKPTKRFYYSWH